MKFRNRPDIEADLVERIRTQARYVEAAAPVVQTGRPVQYRDRSLYGVFLQGSTPDLTRIEDIDLQEGRWYNDFENRTARNVGIIGADVAENLFPNENPLGKHIRVGGHRFEVIGVLVRQGKFLGLFSFDEQIQMPFNTFQKLFGRRRSVTIEIKVASSEMMDRAEDELTGIVRAARGLDALEDDNFTINRQEAFRAAIGGVKVTIYSIGIFLTALSLLVGGIGVMNIMFVSVKERTKEIGIRKAVGAKRRAILIQFLIEAVIVCVIAGIIGIAISAIVAVIINQFFTAYLSVFTIILAFSICVGVGIIFGLIPAWNAARSKPVEALSYE
jgi:putative ABC transport system permease protein